LVFVASGQLELNPAGYSAADGAMEAQVGFTARGVAVTVAVTR